MTKKDILYKGVTYTIMSSTLDGLKKAEESLIRSLQKEEELMALAEEVELIEELDPNEEIEEDGTGSTC